MHIAQRNELRVILKLKCSFSPGWLSLRRPNSLQCTNEFWNIDVFVCDSLQVMGASRIQFKWRARVPCQWVSLLEQNKISRTMRLFEDKIGPKFREESHSPFVHKAVLIDNRTIDYHNLNSPLCSNTSFSAHQESNSHDVFRNNLHLSEMWKDRVFYTPRSVLWGKPALSGMASCDRARI